MRIIYLHGWDGKRDEIKRKILSKFGDEVDYPHINYKSSKNIINLFADKLRQPETIIIGTSFGGYIAYYASSYSDTPALMINPTLFFKNGGELRPDCNGQSIKDKHFIVSAKDEIIDVKKTLKFFNEIKVDTSNVKIFEDLGHEIPIEVFDSIFSEFRNNCQKRFMKEAIEKKEMLKSMTKNSKSLSESLSSKSESLSSKKDRWDMVYGIIRSSEGQETTQTVEDEHRWNDVWVNAPTLEDALNPSENTSIDPETPRVKKPRASWG